MAKYKVRYGVKVNTGNFENARIEIEEEFDEKNMPDRLDALMQVAKMVEGFGRFRKKHPHKFMEGNMQTVTPLND